MQDIDLAFQRIAQFRRPEGSREAFAERLGGDCHKNTVSAWENGRSNLKLIRLDRRGEGWIVSYVGM